MPSQRLRPTQRPPTDIGGKRGDAQRPGWRLRVGLPDIHGSRSPRSGLPQCSQPEAASGGAAPAAAELGPEGVTPPRHPGSRLLATDPCPGRCSGELEGLEARTGALLGEGTVGRRSSQRMFFM